MSQKRSASLPTFSSSASSVAVSCADHMETSDTAVRDISCVLAALSPCLRKAQPSQLRLWDPYYCMGSVKALYARHGFPNCHNEHEDFYAVIKSGTLLPGRRKLSKVSSVSGM